MRSSQKLPDGWRVVELGQVCEFLDRLRIPVNDVERNRRIAGKAHSELYPYYGANGQVGWIDDYIFDEPLVLLAEDGGAFGSTKKPIAYAIHGKTWVNNHAHVLRPKSVLIDLSYCLYSLMIRPDIGALVAGATRDKLNQSVARKIPIPLPPLAEQRRIAAAIEERLCEVERARAAVQAQLDDAHALMAAHLRAVFENAETLLGENRRLGDILIRSTEIIHPGDKAAGSMPFVGLEHIESGTGVRTGSVELALGELTGRKPVFHPGHIVYGYLRPYLNKVWIAEFDGLCSVDQYVYSVRDELAFTDYIAWFMRSPLYMERSPVGSNTSQLPRIRLEEVASVKILLPSLTDQRAILSHIHELCDATFQAIAALKAELDLLDRLPAAILRQAFAGEL